MHKESFLTCDVEIDLNSMGSRKWRNFEMIVERRGPKRARMNNKANSLKVKLGKRLISLLRRAIHERKPSKCRSARRTVKRVASRYDRRLHGAILLRRLPEVRCSTDVDETTGVSGGVSGEYPGRCPRPEGVRKDVRKMVTSQDPERRDRCLGDVPEERYDVPEERWHAGR